MTTVEGEKCEKRAFVFAQALHRFQCVPNLAPAPKEPSQVDGEG